MEKLELTNNMLSLLTKSKKYAKLHSYDGIAEPDGWIEIDHILRLNDKYSLGSVLLELALYKIEHHQADIHERLNDIQLEDDRIKWKFPIWK